MVEKKSYVSKTYQHSKSTIVSKRKYFFLLKNSAGINTGNTCRNK